MYTSSSYTHRQHHPHGYYTAAPSVKPRTHDSYGYTNQTQLSSYEEESYPDFTYYPQQADRAPPYSSPYYTTPVLVQRSTSGSTSSSDNSTAGYYRRTKMSVYNGSPVSTHSYNPKIAIPAAVHALLTSTTALLESLTAWSQGRATEGDVSDVYVKIGEEFNACVVAFAQGGIDLAPIHSTPHSLRDVLEQCLAEDPTPELMKIFMPQVRAIVRAMLEGLRDGGRAGGWTFG